MLDPRFVTLTVPNVPAAELRSEIRRMISEFRKIQELRRKQKKPLIRGIRKLEVTYNPDLQNFHPHFHFIVEGESAANELIEDWLDRNTTGVLLLTNDGELANRLMHPKYEINKVYKATLNKSLKPADLWTISNGVELEDGFIKPDAIAQSDPKNKNVVGIEIHSGKNRIIHRIFENLGYTVDKLDRVLYAGIEKGALKRGEWRELNDKELKTLKKSIHMK
jgi:pseudouridine synthase